MPGADLNHSQIVNPTVPDRASYSKTPSTGGSRLTDLAQTFLLMLIRIAVAERKQVHPCTVRYMFSCQEYTSVSAVTPKCAIAPIVGEKSVGQETKTI